MASVSQSRVRREAPHVVKPRNTKLPPSPTFPCGPPHACRALSQCPVSKSWPNVAAPQKLRWPPGTRQRQPPLGLWTEFLFEDRSPHCARPRVRLTRRTTWPGIAVAITLFENYGYWPGVTGPEMSPLSATHCVFFCGLLFLLGEANFRTTHLWQMPLGSQGSSSLWQTRD